MEAFTTFSSYLISFCITTLVAVYILKLPNKITGATKLVQVYYYDNSVQNFLLDIVLVYLYLRTAHFVSKRLNMKGNYAKLLVVAATTVALSTAFMFYFLQQKPESSFFASWFHETGFKAVAYDVVLVSSVYFVNERIIQHLCN